MIFSKIKVQALVIFMTGACTLFAQSYTNSPGDSIVKATTLGAHAVVMNITQVHPTTDTLHFYWHKLSVSLPQGWTASICDNGLCYTTLEDSGMMIPIVPGDDGLMSIHCQADSNPGIGVIRYTLYEEKTVAHIDTLTWIIAAAVSGLPDIGGSKAQIQCLSGKLSLQNIPDRFSDLEAYDMSGRLLIEQKVHPNETYIVQVQDHASFVVRLSGAQGSYCQKVFNQ